MTPQEREAMQMALDALETITSKVEPMSYYCSFAVEIESLREALAQPEQEPWGYISHKAWKMPVFVEADDLQAANLPFNNPDYTPVYKAPPQREWQGLTDEERYLNEPRSAEEIEYAKAIEAKLKEKNT